MLSQGYNQTMRVMQIGRGLTMKEALGMTHKELSTINLLLDGKTQKEIAYLEQVSEAAISDRIKRIMIRNNYKTKTELLLDCEKLRRLS